MTIISTGLFLAVNLCAQPVPVIEAGKWGFVEGRRMVIAPKYDTVFSFDSTGRVCIACFKVRSASSNKFITVRSLSYSCNYLNAEGKPLVIRNRAGDTCGVFALPKNAISQYEGRGEQFSVSTRGKRFLVDKSFHQLTFRGYHSVAAAPDPHFYLTETENEAGTILAGVINEREEQVIPNNYTSIRFNTVDSLIIACSAGLNNQDDDIYNYAGKRIGSYTRHVEQVTKRFVIHHVYEPDSRYIVYDTETKEDQPLVADEVQLAGDDLLRVRVKNEWFVYDMRRKEKKPVKQS